MQSACPHCGYDFPARDSPFPRTPIAYGTPARLALWMGQWAAVGAILVVLGGFVYCLTERQWGWAVLCFPLGFLLLLANLVVLARVRGRLR